jgi:Flp pilus assembly protein TadG
LTEFALVLPIALLLIFGIVDFGRAIYMYNTLAESARQANRLAIVDPTPASVRAQAKASAPILNLQDADIDVCFKASNSLERDCANATDACAPARVGCLAIVSSRTAFQPLTPVISSIVNVIPLSSTSIGLVEHVP